MKLTSLRVAAAGGAAAALIGGLAACSPSPTPAGQTDAAPAVESTAGHDAFIECLMDNGVPAPPEGGHPGGPPRAGGPPGGGPAQGAPPEGLPPPPAEGGTPPAPPEGGPPPAPPGVDQDTWDAATQACSSLAPAPPQR